MALDKIKNFFGGNEEDEELVVNSTTGENQYYAGIEQMGASGSNKMMLLEPRAYSESQQIADYLKQRNTVVVNLKRVTPDQAKRIVDFLSGTLYAIGGDLQKLGGGIFLCTPNNIDVEGKITDDNIPEKSSKKTKDKEEEEFNW